MKKFVVTIEDSAITDIQDAIDYYNKQQEGLGKKFHTFIKMLFRY